MIQWIKNIAIRWAIKLIRKEIETVELSNPDIWEFRKNLYGKSLSAFMTWSMSKLGAGDKVYTETPIELLKQTLEPLRDDVEGIILKIIDGLNPKILK